METPGWIKEHLGHLAAGGGAGVGGGFVFFAIFKDSIRELLSEWRKSREEARAERAAARAAAGKGEPLKEYLQIVREEMKAQRELLIADIAAQRANEKETIVLLGQMATANERHLDVEREVRADVAELKERLGEVRTFAEVAATRRLN